jgi:hypothetical protein
MGSIGRCSNCQAGWAKAQAAWLFVGDLDLGGFKKSVQKGVSTDLVKFEHFCKLFSFANQPVSGCIMLHNSKLMTASWL